MVSSVNFSNAGTVNLNLNYWGTIAGGANAVMCFAPYSDTANVIVSVQSATSTLTAGTFRSAFSYWHMVSGTGTEYTATVSGFGPGSDYVSNLDTGFGPTTQLTPATIYDGYALMLQPGPNGGGGADLLSFGALYNPLSYSYSSTYSTPSALAVEAKGLENMKLVTSLAVNVNPNGCLANLPNPVYALQSIMPLTNAQVAGTGPGATNPTYVGPFFFFSKVQKTCAWIVGITNGSLSGQIYIEYQRLSGSGSPAPGLYTITTSDSGALPTITSGAINIGGSNANGFYIASASGFYILDPIAQTTKCYILNATSSNASLCLGNSLQNAISVDEAGNFWLTDGGTSATQSAQGSIHLAMTGASTSTGITLNTISALPNVIPALSGIDNEVTSATSMDIQIGTFSATGSVTLGTWTTLSTFVPAVVEGGVWTGLGIPLSFGSYTAQVRNTNTPANVSATQTFSIGQSASGETIDLQSVEGTYQGPIQLTGTTSGGPARALDVSLDGGETWSSTSSGLLYSTGNGTLAAPWVASGLTLS